MRVKNFLTGSRAAYSFIAGALVLLLLFAFLPGCAPEVVPPAEDAYEKYVASLPEGCFPVPRECFEQALEEGQLNIYDWAEWWPEEIYTNFENEFGIDIIRDNYASEMEVVAKFKLYPETPYDVITGIGIRTFYPLKESAVLQEINHEWIPNVNEYLPQSLKEASFDPDYHYGVSCERSLTAYGYNTAYVDDPRIPSWSVLFEPKEEYRGRISLVEDMQEVVGAALKYLGYSWNSDNEAELMEARDLLMQLKPYIGTFDSWPVRPILEEEIWIANNWYGDSLYLHRELSTITGAVPAEGSRMGVDPLVIPIGSQHPAAAHLWINYLFRPRVHAALMEGICYLPSHTTAEQYLSSEAREWWEPVLSEEYQAKCEYDEPKALTGKGLELRSAIWEELKA